MRWGSACSDFTSCSLSRKDRPADQRSVINIFQSPAYHRAIASPPLFCRYHFGFWSSEFVSTVLFLQSSLALLPYKQLVTLVMFLLVGFVFLSFRLRFSGDFKSVEYFITCFSTHLRSFLQKTINKPAFYVNLLDSPPFTVSFGHGIYRL